MLKHYKLRHNALTVDIAAEWQK